MCYSIDQECHMILQPLSRREPNELLIQHVMNLFFCKKIALINQLYMCIKKQRYVFFLFVGGEGCICEFASVWCFVLCVCVQSSVVLCFLIV